MSRRGEVPFVAVRVGRSNDPREVLGLAHELKVNRATALGYVVLWEEFILEVGDAMTGRVRGYTSTHVAAKLGWRGRPAKLLEALKRAGLFAQQKGTFFHPAWLDTPTGDYARRKANDRETWRKEKEAQRNAARARQLENNGADIHPESGWNGSGRPPGLHPENAQKERMNPAGHLPPAPPQGGGELASRRWEWLRDHHKRPTNPVGCMRILAGVSDEEWRMIQWAWTSGAEGGGLISLSKKRLMRRTSYEFLKNGAYLEIRPQWVEKLRGDQRPKATPETVAKRAAAESDDKASRRAQAATFVLAQLADPELSDAKRETIKRRWIEAHGAPGPWEVGEGLQSASPTN